MAGMTEKMTFKVYATVLGAVATIASKKLLEAGWRTASGQPAPDPNDPETSASEAAMWALASGVGLGIVQVALNRYLTERFTALTGDESTARKTTIKL